MKFFILTFIILTLLLVFRFAFAGQLSKEHKTPGLTKGQLQVCPDKPNCINTEYPDDSSHYLPPLHYPVSQNKQAQNEQVMKQSKKIIHDMGGVIITEDKHYLLATFTSSIFKFIDDFEIRNDTLSHTIHIRSASRTGYSDFGVNKRRVEHFSENFLKLFK